MSERSVRSVPMIPFDSPAMIDLRYVKKLIEMLDSSTVDSIEISSDKGMKLRISKSSQQRVSAVSVAPPLAALPAMASVLPPGAPDRPPVEVVAAAPKVEAPKVALLEIKSPMVGTYYSAPEPGAKPYVSVGDRISKGQIVCIIEAMKIMNPIESDRAGTVVSILVENGHPVEFEQPLFVIN